MERGGQKSLSRSIVFSGYNPFMAKKEISGGVVHGLPEDWRKILPSNPGLLAGV